MERLPFALSVEDKFIEVRSSGFPSGLPSTTSVPNDFVQSMEVMVHQQSLLMCKEVKHNNGLLDSTKHGTENFAQRRLR
ncbi:unnamed protein product [Rodentolepis nana]|uniref:Ovule protein n=1 Tax=Rodentolepis nana TaxID=102285 RepID=A0A0R3TZP6_RODNA|nr:unnamed protein product [Rodentolepis nana]